MLFKVLDIKQRADGMLMVSYQCECGGGEYITQMTYFTGGPESSPYDDLRIWLALNAEATELSSHEPTDCPDDIRALIGNPIDTKALLKQYQGNLNAMRQRAERAQQDNDRTKHTFTNRG